MEENSLVNVWPEWSIEKRLGKGSYGVVYKAVRKDENLTSYSAIKVVSIPPDPSEIDSLRSEGLNLDHTKSYFKNIVDEFVNEIKLMESFKGIQNIVSIEDYKVVEKTDEIGWDIYIRMELLTSFNEYICDKKLTEEEVIKLGCDICTALEICNQKNVIHRDIKPENIFVNEFGFFKLGDFGVARRMEGLTTALSTKGTLLYIAPEVYRGTAYDARVDVCSLGIVLYRLLNGNQFPFMDPAKQFMTPQERQSALERRLNGEALPAPGEASPAMANLILKACAHDPEDRFGSASEMKQALLDVKAGTYQMAELNLNRTINIRKDNQNAGPQSGNKVEKNTFGRKKSKAPKIIAGALVVALLIGGGAFAVPRILDNLSEETSQEQGSSGEKTKDSSVTSSPSEKTKEADKTANGENKSEENKESKKETAQYSKGDEEKIASIVAEAEQLAGNEDYAGAIEKIQTGLVVYPKSADLQDRLEQYTEQMAAKVKEQTLNTAADYALAGDYLAAMAVIGEAQEEAPEDEDYKEVYEKYAVAYEDKVVAEALQNADSLVAGGNYTEALGVLNEAKKEISDSEKLNQKYEEVNQEYTEKVATEKKQQFLAAAEDFANKGEYVQAIEVIEEAQKEMPEDENLSFMLDSYKTAYVTGVIGKSNEYVAAGSYSEAITIVEEALVCIPENVALLEQKEYVEKQKPKYFMEECPPYEASGYYRVYTDNKIFMMAGEAYTNGFTINADDATILSNLKKQYTEVQFDLGHVDSTEMYTVNVDIYLDGTLHQSYTINPENAPEHIIVKVDNVKIMKLFIHHAHSYANVGFANIIIK